MSYAQNGEDLVIAEYFGDFKGSLLDIGANDGITFSNSRLLIEKGWSAVLVEPSLAYSKLASLYNGNPKVTCVDEIIAAKHVRVEWFELEDSLLATMNKSLSSRSNVIGGDNLRCRISITYEMLQKRFDNTFDFISIDAEGEDWNILQQIDLTNVKCVIVEYGNNPEMAVLMKDYCKQFGMKEILKNFENQIFVK